MNGAGNEPDDVLANVQTHKCEKGRSVMRNVSRKSSRSYIAQSRKGERGAIEYEVEDREGKDLREEDRHNTTRVRRRHSPGSLSLHSRSVAARREATQRAATLPILFSWLDALQCAARALRYRLLILRLPSERARPSQIVDRNKKFEKKKVVKIAAKNCKQTSQYETCHKIEKLKYIFNNWREIVRH